VTARPAAAREWVRRRPERRDAPGRHSSVDTGSQCEVCLILPANARRKRGCGLGDDGHPSSGDFCGPGGAVVDEGGGALWQVTGNRSANADIHFLCGAGHYSAVGANPRPARRMRITFTMTTNSAASRSLRGSLKGQCLERDGTCRNSHSRLGRLRRSRRTHLLQSERGPRKPPASACLPAWPRVGHPLRKSFTGRFLITHCPAGARPPRSVADLCRLLLKEYGGTVPP
jgi:hypothetical protein